MKKIIILSFFIVVSKLSLSQIFTLKSADLGGQFTNEFVAGNFGCSGNNQSPQLSWANAPAGTKVSPLQYMMPISNQPIR